MVLRRLGNKSKIAAKIIQYFPAHSIYIEPFFGAGGMFFNKPLTKYNFLNDNDSNVFNLFKVLMNEKEQLTHYIKQAPYHQDMFKYAKENNGNNNIEKAALFLYLSSYSLYGKCDTLKISTGNSKQILINNIDKCYQFLTGCNTQFLNVDFRKVLSTISISPEEIKKVFVYADPPYLGTTDNYEKSFKLNDLVDLIELLIGSGYKFAISEFDTQTSKELATKYNLNYIKVIERRSIKNRNIEILMTNFNLNNSLFDSISLQ